MSAGAWPIRIASNAHLERLDQGHATLAFLEVALQLGLDRPAIAQAGARERETDAAGVLLRIRELQLGAARRRDVQAQPRNLDRVHAVVLDELAAANP
jgi:hypothetical protein